MKTICRFRSIQIIIVACLLLMSTFQKSMSQCTSARPGMIVNGVAITGDGNIGFFGDAETVCGFTTPSQSLHLSSFAQESVYNFYFSKPVNNVRFIITGDFGRFDNWGVRFTTNEGLPYLKTISTCLLLVSPRDTRNSFIGIYSDHRGDQTAGGGEFIISADRAFTNLVIRSSGAATATLAVCAESVIPCPNIPTLSTITQPTCENPTGSFRITNYDAANIYTISPSANTMISSEGLVTVPAGASYTVTSGNATCTSNASAAAVVNNLICTQPDAYTVEINQTLTENLRANDGYIPPDETFYIPQPDPAFTNPSTYVPLVVNNTPERKTLTFSSGTPGVYHYLVPVSAGGITVQVPLTITVNTPLPVTLVSFIAKQEGQSVNLNWETSEETNSDRFEVEWGTDGKIWNSIGSVEAANESKVLRKYTFQHSAPVAGQNLYRLKMVDRAANRKDLTFAYSQIRNVHLEAGSDQAVYPNPVTGGTLYLADWTNVKAVDLYNEKGQKVKSYAADEKEKMDVSGVPNGMYVIKAVYENGTFISRQVYINN